MDATLVVHRFVEGKSWAQSYTVPVSVGMTVLEALITIKEKQDPTLSFTCSCRSSICGACAVRVNGNAELSCEILVENLLKRYETDTLTIEPLGNFRVIRDLIVDGMRLMAARKNIVVAANIFGKIKTVTQMIAIVFVLLNGFPFNLFDNSWPAYLHVSDWLCYIATFFSVLSGVIYLKQNIFVITGGEKNE